jgi:DNA processing protein
VRTQIIDPNRPDYPEGLREAPRVARWCQGEPPPLHVRGQLPTGPAVSIIGSREAPADSRAYAHALARRLAEAGWCIVSGGAKGIDAAAHRGALEAERNTVAVLTGGHDLAPYPPRHEKLFSEISERGGLVSLEPDGVQRRRYHFLQRNVVMVAMTSATIVIHAASDGGAIKAARAASELGRAVLFVPECPWRKTARGTLDALRAGATPLWCIDDAVTMLAPFAVTSPTGLDPEQRQLWRAASHMPRHVDRLTESAGLPRAHAAEALLMLVLDGHLEEGPAGHYRRARAL